jgi:4-cresol dehydrogenase (hydroxylating) flavoprotein subunit
MGNDIGLSAFQRAAIRRLGDDQVLADPGGLGAYRANVGAFRREVPLVVHPRTTEEVVEIVSLANAHRVPLAPVSTGRNWGLGSRLPAADGCVVVDLRQMRRIRAVDAEFGYAVVEPGVTQGHRRDGIRPGDQPGRQHP